MLVGYLSLVNCITPDCKGEVTARGLCMSCYTVARRQILRGKTTWLELEQAGKAVPPLPPEARISAKSRYFSAEPTTA